MKIYFVNIGDSKEAQGILISICVREDDKKEHFECLMENKDGFSWSYEYLI